MAFNITPYLRRAEGVYFDRKSLFEGRPGAKRPHDRRAVRDQIAEYVAGFANNEGRAPSGRTIGERCGSPRQSNAFRPGIRRGADC